MQRPFLERASWLAGIVSAVIAVVVWLNPSSTEPAQVGQKNVQSVPPSVPKENAEAKVTTTNSSAAFDQKPVITRWSCDGVASDLQPALAAAKNIYYTESRDDAFLDLSRKALCLENYSLFEEAAGRIYYTEKRDGAYSDGVDFVLGVRKFDLAEKLAGKIYYTAKRDAARARVVALASTR